MKRQENPKIVLDEDLCGFRAGTVDALDFAYAAVLHIKNLEDENERLTDKRSWNPTFWKAKVNTRTPSRKKRRS